MKRVFSEVAGYADGCCWTCISTVGALYPWCPGYCLACCCADANLTVSIRQIGVSAHGDTRQSLDGWTEVILQHHV